MLKTGNIYLTFHESNEKTSRKLLEGVGHFLMHTVLCPLWNKSIVDLVLADKEELIADLKSHRCLGTGDCYLSVFALCKQNMASGSTVRSFRRVCFLQFKQLAG